MDNDHTAAAPQYFSIVCSVISVCWQVIATQHDNISVVQSLAALGPGQLSMNLM